MTDTRHANADQIEYWNSDEAHHWVEHQGRYDSMLGPYAQRLLTAANVAPHERVLDVGCGTGTTTLVAAAVATKGEALGVDISEPMILRARARARAQGLDNAQFEVSDAQTTPFHAEIHDVVISRFGVMFFDDPEAAFTNLRRTMRPGARLVFVCWQNLADNEWMLVPGMAAATHVPLPDLGEPGAPGPFAFGDTEHVQRILAGAGFGDVSIEPVVDSILLGGGGTLDEAIEFLRGTGMARAVFADAAPDAIARAIDAVRDALASYETPDGIRLGGAAWLVNAIR
jgi:SAM-dependent methyltransferase